MDKVNLRDKERYKDVHRNYQNEFLYKLGYIEFRILQDGMV